MRDVSCLTRHSCSLRGEGVGEGYTGDGDFLGFEVIVCRVRDEPVAVNFGRFGGVSYGGGFVVGIMSIPAPLVKGFPGSPEASEPECPAQFRLLGIAQYRAALRGFPEPSTTITFAPVNENCELPNPDGL